MLVEWIIKSLKKNGEANIVLPDGIFTNIGNTNLKEFILNTCYIECIVSLPVGTFFNTLKKTFILTLHKKNDKELNKKQPYLVYTYLCSTIGETMDIYRFDIDENDLHNCVDLYQIYKSNKDNSKAKDIVKNDPRAKLINIDHFTKDSNWDIDLCWSDKEKEDLGIKKADSTMSISELELFIDDLFNDIKEYKENLKCLK